MTLVTAGLAYAAVSTFAPASGETTPGGSTGTSFTVTPPDPVLLIPGSSCLTATVSPNPLQFNVSFTGLGVGGCVSEVTVVDMVVSAGANAAPGPYTVTVRELAVGGTLLNTYQWPFAVVAETTTTSTTSTSTTTTSTTTTTVPSTNTTTTIPSTTTSTTISTTTTGPATTTTTPDGPGSTTSVPGPTTTVTTGSDRGDDAQVVVGLGSPQGPDGGGPALGSPTRADDADPEAGEVKEPVSYASLQVSDSLRNNLEKALPGVVANVVLSPLVIAEILLRALGHSAAGYLIPLLIVGLIGLWLTRRMRKEVGDAEFELPHPIDP